MTAPIKMLLSTKSKYLSKNHIQGFQKYKYSSMDTNPVGVYIMHPLWNWLIQFFPQWIAPNLMTFVGFLFIIKSFILLSYFDYYFYASSDTSSSAPIPSWVFAIVAINVFVAYALDCLDGRQARRTGTSGPLGELFDHGLDSWIKAFIPIFVYSIFGRADYSLPPIRLYYICWTGFFNFYTTQLEKYITGTLYLPWSYDLTMLGTVMIFGVTSLGGHQIWKRLMFDKYSISQLLEVYFYSSTCVLNTRVVLHNVYKAYKTKTGKSLSFWEGIQPMIPFTTFFMLSNFWLYHSPTNIIEKDPRAFCLLIGSIFSNICCRLIIAGMSNTRCQIFHWILIPFGIIILVSILIPSLELFLLYISLLFAVSYHIHYGTCVIRQMCDHFEITFFRIHSKC